MEILAFLVEHWVFSTFFFWPVALVAIWLILLPVKLITRTYRFIMVLCRGWPPEHLDADGDHKPAPKEVN